MAIWRIVLASAFMLSGGMATAQEPPAVASARAMGAIGERFDGYVGAAGQIDEATARQVRAVNIQRRTLYSQLAVKRRASPEEVGMTAGCQLLARTSVGGAYMLDDGIWRRRAPGETVKLPRYCGS